MLGSSCACSFCLLFSTRALGAAHSLGLFAVPQDDELEIRFKLPRNQVLKILGFLTTERLVCRREVKESRRGKRSRVAGPPGTEAPAASAAGARDDSGGIINVFYMYPLMGSTGSKICCSARHEMLRNVAVTASSLFDLHVTLRNPY